MPLGMGRLGWAYLGYWHPWFRVPPYWWLGFHPYWPYWSPWGALPREQEIAMLNDQARMLEQELSQIKARLEELQK